MIIFIFLSFYSATDSSFEQFENEEIGTCSTVIKQLHEISRAEATERKYKLGKVAIINRHKNENGYEYATFLDFLLVFIFVFSIEKVGYVIVSMSHQQLLLILVILRLSS